MVDLNNYCAISYCVLPESSKGLLEVRVHGGQSCVLSLKLKKDNSKTIDSMTPLFVTVSMSDGSPVCRPRHAEGFWRLNRGSFSESERGKETEDTIAKQRQGQTNSRILL